LRSEERSTGRKASDRSLCQVKKYRFNELMGTKPEEMVHLRRGVKQKANYRGVVISKLEVARSPEPIQNITAIGSGEQVVVREGFGSS